MADKPTTTTPSTQEQINALADQGIKVDTSIDKPADIAAAYAEYVQKPQEQANADAAMQGQWGDAKNSSEAYQNVLNSGGTREQAQEAANAYGRMNAALNNSNAANMYGYSTEQMYGFASGKVNAYQNSLPTNTFSYDADQADKVMEELRLSNEDIKKLAAQMVVLNNDMAIGDTQWSSIDLMQVSDVLGGRGYQNIDMRGNREVFDAKTMAKIDAVTGVDSPIAQQLGLLGTSQQFNNQIIDEMTKIRNYVEGADKTVEELVLSITTDGLIVSCNGLSYGNSMWAEKVGVDTDGDGVIDCNMYTGNKNVFGNKDFVNISNVDSDNRNGGNLGTDDILYRNDDEKEYYGFGVHEDENGKRHWKNEGEKVNPSDATSNYEFEGNTALSADEIMALYKNYIAEGNIGTKYDMLQNKTYMERWKVTEPDSDSYKVLHGLSEVDRSTGICYVDGAEVGLSGEKLYTVAVGTLLASATAGGKARGGDVFKVTWEDGTSNYITVECNKKSCLVYDDDKNIVNKISVFKKV